MARLSGKVAIVTGGATGIGEATAIRFAQEEARVAVFDVSEEAGRQTVETIRGDGGEAEFFRCDVSSEDEVSRAVGEVTNGWGQLDVLVNNAAVTGVNKLAHEVSAAEWDAIFAINVRGVFLCTKHALKPMMAQKRGSIVNFSSIYALAGNDDIPPYHATKGAVLAMTKTDAICYGRHGIRVNAVHPGSTKTPLFMKAGETYPGGLDHYLDMMSAKHVLPLAEPVDIANCVLFLASDESRFVTGSSLVCDGGYTAQ